MKLLSLLIASGLIGLFSLSTLSSCNKGYDEKNLPVEEVLPLTEEEVLPLDEESGFAPDQSGVIEEELRRSKPEARNPKAETIPNDQN